MRRTALIALLAYGIALLVAAAEPAASATRAHPNLPRAHGASTVRLIVVRARDGETAALAPVVIHGRVFPFLIDTGSTRSLVDLALARKLGLRSVGGPIRISGVGCTSVAHSVRLANWRIGTQRLPAIVATSTKIEGASGRAFGLLGSDVLSRFGAVRIDYRRGVLTLG
jgi:predicted aspartyl protease